MESRRSDILKPALEGGAPAMPAPCPPMYPGGNLIDAREERAVIDTLRQKRLFRYYGPTPGPSKVDELEQRFAQKMGARRALAVTSGTAALICAVQALGIGPGDEVIIPAYTWIATAAAVLAAGAIPVVAEVDASLTLDPDDLPNRLSDYTRAIIPVHMRGVPCRMAEIMAFARAHDLKVIEDTAQADGATYRGQRLGTLGDAGCYSLQFNKIITSGEGGMLVTDDEQLWQRALMYHDVIGGLRNEIPAQDVLWGINFRMPELLAAVALAQLDKLDPLLETMRARKAILRTALRSLAEQKGLYLQEIPDPEGEAAVAFILFATGPDQARRLSRAISAEHVEAYTLYDPNEVDYHVYTHWIPIVAQRAWNPANLPWAAAPRPVDYSPEACPHTLDLLSRAVHIDVNPLYTGAEIEAVAEAIEKALHYYA
ncbi:MAG: aminotransferase class I/II-fold pyridoxal phosphate-dependent enzyme [Anaerolineae bacterium]|nr:aminotransferase class I/II-fold pyridoxal phosphate-dependent enzyme [Anaerolineae bacterium]